MLECGVSYIVVVAYEGGGVVSSLCGVELVELLKLCEARANQRVNALDRTHVHALHNAVK